MSKIIKRKSLIIFLSIGLNNVLDAQKNRLQKEENNLLIAHSYLEACERFECCQVD